MGMDKDREHRIKDHFARYHMLIPIWCTASDCWCMGCINHHTLNKDIKITKDEYDELVKNDTTECTGWTYLKNY